MLLFCFLFFLVYFSTSVASVLLLSVLVCCKICVIFIKPTHTHTHMRTAKDASCCNSCQYAAARISRQHFLQLPFLAPPPPPSITIASTMAYIQFIQQVSNLTTLICPPRYVPQLTTELGQQVFPRYYVPYVTQAQNLDSQSKSECQGAEGGWRGK